MLYASEFLKHLLDQQNDLGRMENEYCFPDIDKEIAKTMLKMGYLEPKVQETISKNSPHAQGITSFYVSEIVDEAKTEILPFLQKAESKAKVIPEDRPDVTYGNSLADYAEYIRIHKEDQPENSMFFDAWKENSAASWRSENAFPPHDNMFGTDIQTLTVDQYNEFKEIAALTPEEIEDGHFIVLANSPILIETDRAAENFIREVPIEFFSVQEAVECAHGVFDEKTVNLYRECRKREAAITKATGTKNAYQKAFKAALDQWESSYIDIDSKLAAQMLVEKHSPKRIAATLQKYSPQAVLSASYGAAIVARAKADFLQEAKAAAHEKSVGR